jgi:hypothetical protein
MVASGCLLASEVNTSISACATLDDYPCLVYSSYVSYFSLEALSCRYADNVKFRDPVADAAAPTFTDFLLVLLYYPVLVSDL